MAQIFAFGHVENDLAPKKSQKDSTYVCFGFTEQTGKGQFQYYQVWAWEDEVSRLIQLGVKRTAGYGSPAHSSWWTVPQAMGRKRQRS